MRKGVFLCALGCVFLLTGCMGRIDRTLPENAIKFEWQVAPGFTEKMAEDAVGGGAGTGITYRNRLYVTYAGIKNFLPGNEIGKCIGFAGNPEDGPEEAGDRVYLLKNDGSCDYLYYETISGLMDVRWFLRAADTKGRKIKRYSFMDSSAYTGAGTFWGEE
ncbi:MAG: hypothetical protein IJ733_09320 [Lachnospiraceae bacterium]|nr:hypothetical protein [Lachnospiraceae bacterium]